MICLAMGRSPMFCIDIDEVFWCTSERLKRGTIPMAIGTAKLGLVDSYRFYRFGLYMADHTPSSKPTTERWERIMVVFNEARDLPVGTLRDACSNGTDPDIVVEVQKMLARHEEHKQGSRFLDRPVLGTEFEIDRKQLDSIQNCTNRSESNMVGQWIGQHEIVKVLGSGGMGVVYEAQQDQPKRRVALKMMRRMERGANLHAASQRFRREIEVLGQLQHSNIAQVYEAGLHYEGSVREDGEGVPYFVMELVQQARTICEYVVENELDSRQRLILFTLVCDGVQHGHRNGIIHRDLKPGNILVGTDRQPKVIDFGVAKALTGQLNVTTLQTDAGRLIGTVQYMAPEQCDVNGRGGLARPVDTRSDVYSLGVILYRLLCDRLPYDTSDSSLVTAARTVCEAEIEPLGRMDQCLRGDLEAIVLKAMARDPEKRYQSVGGLAEDIRRYLNGERINARVQTWMDRLLGRVQKHPVLTTAFLCVLLAVGIVGGTAVGTWYLRQRPAYVMLNDQNDAAQLFSVTGDELHKWDGAYSTVMLEQPNDIGWKKLVAIGFKTDGGSIYAGQLCLFDTAHLDGEPVVVPALQMPDKRDEQGQGQTDKDADREMFNVTHLVVADVFEDVPGDEIIAAWAHMQGYMGSLCIYNRSGEVLYQRWHKGHFAAIVWDTKQRQIICAGYRNDLLRDEPEYAGVVLSDKHNVRVLFALKPNRSHEQGSVIWSREHGCSSGVQWYRCCVPATTWEVFTDWKVIHHANGNGGEQWHIQFLEMQSGVSINVPFDVLTGESLTAQPSNGYAKQEGLPEAQSVGLCEYLPPREALEPNETSPTSTDPIGP